MDPSLFGITKPVPKAGRRAGRQQPQDFAGIDPLSAPVAKETSEEPQDEQGERSSKADEDDQRRSPQQTAAWQPQDAVKPAALSSAAGSVSPLSSVTTMSTNLEPKKEQRHPQSTTIEQHQPSSTTPQMARTSSTSAKTPSALSSTPSDLQMQSTAIFSDKQTPFVQQQQPLSSKPISGSQQTTDEGMNGATSISELESQLQKLNQEITVSQTNIQVFKKRNMEEEKEGNFFAQEAMAAAEKRRDDAKQAIQQCHEQKESRINEIKQRTNERMRTIQSELTAHVQAELASETKRLENEVEVLQSEVVTLEEKTKQFQKEASEESSKNNDGSAATLLDFVTKMFLGQKTELRDSIKAMISSEIRNTVFEVAGRKQEERTQRQLEFHRSLSAYRTGRNKSFQEFREKRKVDRRESLEEQFAALKARREKHVSAMREKMQASTKEREELFDLDVQRSRADAQKSVERLVHSNQQTLQSEETVFESKIRELEAQLQSEVQHTKKFHQAQYDALTQRLVSTDFEHSKSSFVMRDCFEDVLASMNVVKERIHSTGEKVIAALLEVKQPPGSASSSSSSLFLQNYGREMQNSSKDREACIAQLRNVISERQSQVSTNWHRLSTLLVDFEDQLMNFSKNVGDGRHTINATRQRIDLLRSTWEAEHRKRLSCGADGSERGTYVMSGEELQLEVLLQVHWKIQDLVSKTQSLSKLRQSVEYESEYHLQETEAKHGDIEKLHVLMLAKYDELSKVAAFTDMKVTQLAQEEYDLNDARKLFMEEVGNFKRKTEQVQRMSQQIQEESQRAAETYKENVNRLKYTQYLTRGSGGPRGNQQYLSARRGPGYPNGHRSAAGFLGEFSKLVRLSSGPSSGDESSVKSITYQDHEPVHHQQQPERKERREPVSGQASREGSQGEGYSSLTTPSPDEAEEK